jgi:predicted transcriptional regulator
MLLAHDRCKTDDLPITQDLIARLLGVRRASVSECISWFEERGIVRRSRGLVGITNRSRLEALSCSCYGLIRKEQEKMFRPIAQ